jgi:hypothetical protein
MISEANVMMAQDGFFAAATPSVKPNSQPLSEVAGAISPEDRAKQRAMFRYAAEIAGLSHEQPLKRYNADKAMFDKALEKWLPADADKLRSILEATRFIDWADMAVELIDAYRSRGRLSILERGLPYLYNRTNSPNDPEFANMRAVNALLKSTQLEPGLQRLAEVHKIAMRGQVDQIETRALGKARDHGVIGDESGAGLLPIQIRRVNANPYLSYRELSDQKRRGKDDRVPGMIVYPEPASIKDEALERIREGAPEVYQRVMEFRAFPKSARERHENQHSRLYRALTKDLVSALAEERYATFNATVASLGELDTPDKVLSYIKTVALHYRDLVSIHPLADGNGRTLRFESLYAPLDRAGISRPRLYSPDLDILHSPSGWVREVERGVLGTHYMYLDVAERVNRGLRVESSPELVFPNLVREVGIELRTRGRKQSVKNAALQGIDGGQFGAYVDTRLLGGKTLQRELKSDAVRVLGQLRDEYKDFAKRTLIMCSVPGKGVEAIGVRFVDFDQRATFGVMQCENADAWKYKMNRWYTSTMVWRGMCQTDAEMTTDDCLAIFKKLGWISLSNQSIGLAGKTDVTVRRSVQRDFDAYNTDLLSGRLHEMVLDHVNEGTRYDESYGASTSRNWSIAAGFAWGRGAFGYDNKAVKAAQGEIQSRVMIGAYQGLKDVDTRRFRMVDDKFRSRSGRQQEIMAVGGIDPDAIMVVQLLDERRGIQRSFVRNPSNPSEVLELDGGFHPGRDKVETIPAEHIVARHSLGDMLPRERRRRR